MNIALDLSPNQIEYRFNKSITLASGLDKFSEAIECLETVLEIEPDNELAHELIEEFKSLL